MTDHVSGTSCPLPDAGDDARVTLAHGEGGRLMRRLIQQRIVPVLDSGPLAALGDAARLGRLSGRLALSTDSFVVSPLFFPGGDIGKLAVYGTVNDLAVAGARPKWISLAMILEEGLPLTTLDRVLASIAAAAELAAVQVVTGDTKVVPRGAADGMFLTTTGVGEIVEPPPPGPAELEDGDALIVSGPIGRHGVAILSAREQLGFDPPPKSDCASLAPSVEALRSAGAPIRAMRDATRGGVAAVLHEWAEASGRTLSIDESRVPLTDDVRGACELLGLDPLHVANEGTMLVAVAGDAADAALAALHGTPVSNSAALIGRVRRRSLAPVLVRRGLGRDLPLDEPAGAPMPRIC
ncbi:MAG: hydrogenase expression/formation protein HypE [Pirellulaceae bacterium]